MSRFRVEISAHVDQKISQQFGPERSGAGRPSVYDFETGPLAAARLAFTGFDELTVAADHTVRSVTIVDAFFGAVVFTGVLVGPNLIEIADVGIDDGYWDHIAEDPSD